MISLPLRPTQIAGPLIMTLLVVLCFGLGEWSMRYLTFDRLSLNAFEYWRFLTGNFLHTNSVHLLLNLGGLWLLWLVHGDDYRTKTYVLVVCVSCLGVSLGLYFFTPELHRYVGLSGALHGVFFFSVINDMTHKILTGWLLFLGGCVKLLNEQFGPANKALEDLIDASVAVDAHLYGAITGIALFGLVFVITGKKKKDIKNPPQGWRV